MTRTSIDVLDEHYAEALGCKAEDLNSGELTVVAKDPRDIKFARGVPLVVFSIGKKDGAVISVRPDLEPVVQKALANARASGLDDRTCDAVAESGVDAGVWFRGYRLYCEPRGFVDRTIGTVRDVTVEDEHALQLHRKWGGRVLGQIEGGAVVSWAAVKVLSDVVWDLSVETLPEYRGRGFAKSALSAALRLIFDNGKLAAWGCDRDNAASLATARSLGFVDYALDFGCVEKEAVLP